MEKKINENVMSSWYLIWPTFEEVAWQKISFSNAPLIFESLPYGRLMLFPFS